MVGSGGCVWRSDRLWSCIVRSAAGRRHRSTAPIHVLGVASWSSSLWPGCVTRGSWTPSLLRRTPFRKWVGLLQQLPSIGQVRGVDPGKSVSYGHDKRPGGRNSPTVYNAGLQFVQFWDGRAATLAAQASGPMMNPVEMGMSGPDAVLAYIRLRPRLRAAVSYGISGCHRTDHDRSCDRCHCNLRSGAPNPPHAGTNILRVTLRALTEPEKQGLRVFLHTGCAACHAGVDLGGNSYETVGRRPELA